MDRNNITATSVPRAPEHGKSFHIRPVFLGLGIIDAFGEYSFPPHTHTEYEVICIVQGDYVCLLNNQKVALTPRQILIVKPGDSHEDFCRPPLKYFGIRFQLDFSWYTGDEKPSLFAKSCSANDQIVNIPQKMTNSIIDKLKKEAETKDFVSAYMQDSLLLEFFWLLVRNIHERAISPWFTSVTQEQAFSMRLMRYFQTNITKNLQVMKMAKYMGMSESSLAHKCRALTGNSPARIFRKCKVDQAILMLKNTDMSVKEISEYLGFENQYHFSKVFKQLVKQTPSSLRNKS